MGWMESPMRWAAGICAGLALGGAVGCAIGEHRAAPLPTGAFGPSKPTIPTDPESPVDRGGVLPSEHPNPEGRVARPSDTRQEIAERDLGSVDQLSPVVKQNTASPSERAFNLATSRASVTGVTPGATSGGYVTLGGVLAEVNNTPIYADKVVLQISPVLAARAKESSREQFRQIAMKEIRDQLQALVSLELDYTAALRNLDSKDVEYAEGLTADWRRHKIAEAQGSLELARKQAAERGQDWDEMLTDQHHFFMSQIYLQKRLVPRIQVTADDLRRYYDQHPAEFTKPATVRFRLIKVSVQQVGDREKARAKANDLRQRIVEKGEDFASIASTTNDPVLLKNGGELTVQRGAFGVEKVEQAVWAEPVGAVTQVIETPDAFYIAKVEDKTNAQVAQFDDELAQRAIHDKLWSEQFRALRQKDQELLRKQALIRSDENMINTAIDMAMENYALWSGKQARNQ
jgi:parvulin-like peptidyl-prolyl isomerase